MKKSAENVKNTRGDGIDRYLGDIKSRIDSGIGSPVSYPYEKERLLLRAIRTGDGDTARRLLNEILGCIFFSCAYDTDSIKLRALELTVLMSRAALDGGADDFVSKPFGMMELLARVRAVLRRSAPSGADGGFQIGSLYVSPPRHIVRVEGRDVQLTNKEFELLCLLVENRGIVLTRGTLMDKVWGFDCDRENRTLDVHIRTLRVKLGEAGSCIETVRGVGYKIGSGV